MTLLVTTWLLQDLSMHKEEIHSKLVAIMRERLATNLKQLPLIATTWASSPPPQGSPLLPSNFAQTNAKQLRILSQVGDLLPVHSHRLLLCCINQSYAYQCLRIVLSSGQTHMCECCNTVCHAKVRFGGLHCRCQVSQQHLSIAVE